MGGKEIRMNSKRKSSGSPRRSTKGTKTFEHQEMLSHDSNSSGSSTPWRSQGPSKNGESNIHLSNNGQALINVIAMNPPVPGLPRDSVQLEELASLLLKTDENLQRPAAFGAPRYLQHITAARNLVHGILFYAFRSTEIDYQYLVGKDQRVGQTRNPTHNWRWIFSHCPVFKSAWLNTTTSTIQSYSIRLGNCLSFDDEHYLSPFGHAICFILKLFYHARYGRSPLLAVITRKADQFLQIPENLQYLNVTLYLDFNCPTIALLGINSPSNFPFAVSIQADITAVVTSEERIEDEQDVLFQKVVEMMGVANDAAKQLGGIRQQKKAAEEVVKDFERGISKYEKIYNDAVEFINRNKLALQIGSTMLLENSADDSAFEEMVTTDYTKNDNDINRFGTAFVQTASNGKPQFRGRMIGETHLSLAALMSRINNAEDLVRHDLLLSDSSGLPSPSQTPENRTPFHSPRDMPNIDPTMNILSHKAETFTTGFSDPIINGAMPDIHPTSPLQQPPGDSKFLNSNVNKSTTATTSAPASASQEAFSLNANQSRPITIDLFDYFGDTSEDTLAGRIQGAVSKVTVQATNHPSTATQGNSESLDQAQHDDAEHEPEIDEAVLPSPLPKKGGTGFDQDTLLYDGDASPKYE